MAKLGIRRAGAVVVAVAAGVAALADPSAAKPARAAGSGSVGYDISYPQCGGPFPQSPAFGVVGVNDGVAYSRNPCLGAGDGPSELAWAEGASNHAPAFYANTADPGAVYSSHWPVGQASPRVCTVDAPDSAACSYDYGWNAARDSFTDAVDAEVQLHGSGFDAAGAAAAARWWLDVETANSWETLEPAYGQTPTARENDTQALLGAVDALHTQGVATVGVYSTAVQWTQITGGSTVTGSRFSQDPSWVAGNRGSKQARGQCGATGFTGGPVELAQYPQSGFDADIACL